MLRPCLLEAQGWLGCLPPIRMPADQRNLGPRLVRQLCDRGCANQSGGQGGDRQPTHPGTVPGERMLKRKKTEVIIVTCHGCAREYLIGKKEIRVTNYCGGCK